MVTRTGRPGPDRPAVRSNVDSGHPHRPLEREPLQHPLARGPPHLRGAPRVANDLDQRIRHRTRDRGSARAAPSRRRRPCPEVHRPPSRRRGPHRPWPRAPPSGSTPCRSSAARRPPTRARRRRPTGIPAKTTFPAIPSSPASCSSGCAQRPVADHQQPRIRDLVEHQLHRTQGGGVVLLGTQHREDPDRRTLHGDAQLARDARPLARLRGPEPARVDTVLDDVDLALGEAQLLDQVTALLLRHAVVGARSAGRGPGRRPAGSHRAA